MKNYPIYQRDIINDVIQQVLFFCKLNCRKFAQSFFDKVESLHFDDAIKVFEDSLMPLTKIEFTPLEIPHTQIKQNILSNLDDDSQKNSMTDTQQLQIFSEEELKCEKIIIQKEREKQSDERILNKWKKFKTNFFRNKIQQSLVNANVNEEFHTQIIEVFIDADQKFSRGFYLEDRKIRQYFQDIQHLEQLKESFYSQIKQFLLKVRQCPPLLQIIRLKLNTLKIIYIQYSPYFQPKKLLSFSSYRYSISAFELFQVVNQNKLLTQLTLKGVQIQRFQQFINELAQKQQANLNWKHLKIAIDTKVQFWLSSQNNNLSNLKELTYFSELFYSLSDIAIVIELQGWRKINYWSHYLQDLWKCLRRIKRIKINLKRGFGRQTIQVQSFPIVRSALFGELATFTEIAQLCFEGFKFSQLIYINDFLVIQRIFKTLFENNTITHLELYNCDNFPLLPKITTLRSVNIGSQSFRNNFAFMNQITQNNHQLRSIKCKNIVQQWQINEKTFNQLQNLQINSISFDDILPDTPSNIKNLQIQLENCEFLLVIFPKLTNIIYLSLYGNFGHQLICIIPSPHLEELQIQNNNELTNFDLKMIDLKWPYLRYLLLEQCNQITKDVWSLCQFKGLVQLNIDKNLRTWKRDLQRLKMRGVTIQ